MFHDDITQLKTINLLKVMGFEIDERGVCFGLAHAAADLFIYRGIKDFDNTIRKMELENPGDYLLTINALQERYLLLTKKARLEAEQKLHDLEQANGKNSQVYKDAFHTEFRQFMDRAFLEKFSEEERVLFKIKGLLQSTAFHFLAEKFPEIYGPLPSPTSQDAKTTLPLLSRSDDPIERIDQFCGAYNPYEWFHYLRTLRQAISTDPNFSEPFVMTIGSASHCVTLSYDPQSKEWGFMDPNEMPTRYYSIENEVELSKNLLRALSDNDMAMVSTQIFAKKSTQEAVRNITNNWKKESAFEAIHNINIKKVKSRDSNGYSLLYVAAKSGDIATLEKLFAYNTILNESKSANLIDIDEPFGKNQTTALWVALLNNQVGALEVLLKNKANFEWPILDINMTPLIFIADNANQNEAAALLIKAGANVNAATKEGFTPLIQAAISNNDAGIKLLLDNGADPNTVFSSTQDTGLHMAVLKNNRQAVEALLKSSQLQINYQNKSDITALHIACENQNLEMIKLLIQHGAKIDIKNILSQTPWDIIKKTDNKKIVEYFLTEFPQLASVNEIVTEKKEEVRAVPVNKDSDEAIKFLSKISNANNSFEIVQSNPNKFRSVYQQGSADPAEILTYAITADDLRQITYQDLQVAYNKLSRNLPHLAQNLSTMVYARSPSPDRNILLKLLQKNNPAVPFNLRGIDLSGSNFSNVWNRQQQHQCNLQNCDLRKSNFTGLNISHSLMVNANLEGCNFSETTLRDTNFSSANLNSANFRKADLTGANLSYASLKDVDFKGAKLNKVTFIPNEIFADETKFQNYLFTLYDQVHTNPSSKELINAITDNIIHYAIDLSRTNCKQAQQIVEWSLSHGMFQSPTKDKLESKISALFSTKTPLEKLSECSKKLQMPSQPELR